MLPFFAAMIAALMLITYIPSLSLWLPVKTKQLKKADVTETRFLQTLPDVDDEENADDIVEEGEAP